MGLFGSIARLFGFGSRNEPTPSRGASAGDARPNETISPPPSTTPSPRKPVGLREGRPLRFPLRALRYEKSLVPTPSDVEVVETPVAPYAFARFGPFRDTFLDLSQDLDQAWLSEFGLPSLATPEQLAEWLELPLGELAWLANHCDPDGRPRSIKGWHYTPVWIRKKSGGYRLLESPKPKLKAVQAKILDEILSRIPAHRSAHGFVRGRSAVSNADRHVGAGVVYKLDLENFYGNIRYNRVAAIFRTVGFSRDVALWLARLTTSMPPYELRRPRDAGYDTALPYHRHLPQGAATSPALANLSAFALDVRLTGLAKSYNAVYTRYADDLTFSGPQSFVSALRQFIPLSQKIIRDEHFTLNRSKRRVLRRNQRMTVTGIVVNDTLNMSRRDYDRLKATLFNCVTHGPNSQNRDQHPDFAAHLRGRVEYARQLNPVRGEKLLALYDQIEWD